MNTYAKALARKVTDKVSDAMSYPARRKAEKVKQQADYDVAVIKDYREMRKSPGVLSQHPQGMQKAAEYRAIKRKLTK